MSGFHAFLGFAIVGAFALLALWGLATAIARRGPGKAYWWLLGGIQGVLLVQLVAGIVLLLMGRRQPILHYFYGVGFPVLVLAGAHWVARESFAEKPWIPFSVAGFVAFGLTLRALMTGLGIG